MKVLTNGSVVLPEGIRDDLDVVIENGKISALQPRNSGGSDAVDLNGGLLAPGLIDVHLHGAVGRDAMEATVEAFSAISDYHTAGGTTSLLLTTATAPLERIAAVLDAVRTNPALARVLGVHVEGPFISPVRKGAQRAEFIRNPDGESAGALLEFAEVIKRVTLAPELPGALALVDELRSRDVAVSAGHSDAWDEEARAGFVHGIRHTTHTFNCMSSARKRGSQRVAGLLEFALSEPEITCELIADGHHVSPTLMRMLYRAKGAHGICLVSDATAGAGLPNGSGFALSGNECIVRDGVGWLSDGSALAGSASRLIDGVRTLVRAVGVPLHEAIAMASATPARTVGLAGKKGSIQPGADADFVVLSDELEVLRTFIAGREVYRKSSERK